MQCFFPRSFKSAIESDGYQTVAAVASGLPSVRCLIPDRLAFASGSAHEIQQLKQSLMGDDVIFISSQLHRKYVPYALDFGPVNLGIVHQFCVAFANRLASASSSLIIYCFETSAACRANACFLLAAFMMLSQGWTLDQASSAFGCSRLPFLLKPFRDATFTVADFGLSLHDCLAGLVRASELGWYSQSSFDLASYEALDDPLSGDIHEVCPKFVAFKGPLAINSAYLQTGEVAFPPSKYVPILKQLGVTCVARLNEDDTYDR